MMEAGGGPIDKITDTMNTSGVKYVFPIPNTSGYHTTQTPIEDGAYYRTHVASSGGLSISGGGRGEY